MSKRPEKTEYYLNIAREVSLRSTCLRRRFGAVILKDDQIISTGYVGAPRGAPNCLDIGKCPREEAKIPAGERYELCRSVHAEANAIINAARAGVSVLGGTLYLYGENVKDGSIAEARPCKMCKRMIINAGIRQVVVKTPEGKKSYSIEEWVVNDKGLFGQEDLQGY
ncbi:MAG: cytidine deaminase [Candidatus Aenigmarchaeota archaeon]|nr:cytidine deaminase [Candidatus Aenigmarchaeota archaeon]